jgi:hypothetical protein
MHDIGYVRGILKGDDQSGYVIDDSGQKVNLPRGSSDAALEPYHVDRSKLFVLDRVKELDAARIARAIEATRFPPSALPDDEDIEEEGSLVPPPTSSVSSVILTICARQTRLLRIRRDRHEPSARLQLACGRDRTIPPILLEHGVPSAADRHPLSQRHRDWATMDCKPL